MPKLTLRTARFDILLSGEEARPTQSQRRASPLISRVEDTLLLIQWASLSRAVAPAAFQVIAGVVSGH